MYQQLAHLYDWPGVLDFSDQVMARAESVLEQHGIHPPSVILDLGCGTGTLTVAMAQAGWRIMGLDISQAMLAQAKSKAHAVQADIPWIQADMRDFQLDQPVEVVFCFYDTLNHLLTMADLEKALQCIHNVLKPNGLFLFDINTWSNYEAFWTGSDQWEGPNVRLTFQSRFDPETGRSQVEIIADEYTDEGFENRSEVVYEQFYSESDMRQLLEKTGFQVLSVQPFHLIELDQEDEAPLKTFWVCQKRH